MTDRRGYLSFSNATSDQLEIRVPISQQYRNEFENRYGHPTDIDKVWGERDSHQDFLKRFNDI